MAPIIEINLQELRLRINKYGRLKLAKELGISYSVLGNKLNGYCSFSDEEIDQILKILPPQQGDISSINRNTNNKEVN